MSHSNHRLRTGAEQRSAGAGPPLIMLALCIVIFGSLPPNQPATVRAEPAPPSTLDILHYNVQFLTPWNPGATVLGFKLPDTIAPGHWPNLRERAEAIGAAIACNDIVALNETINDDRRIQIIHAMERVAPQCGKPDYISGNRIFDVIDGPDVAGEDTIGLDEIWDAVIEGDEAVDEPLIGDEVTIISRLPIIRVDSYIYRARSGADSFAAKGVLYARLWRGGDAPANAVVDVFATHLQADHPDVRRAQLHELAEFVRRKSDPGVPRILMGDMNVDGSPAAQQQPDSDYRLLTQLFSGELGLVDAGTHLGATNEERTARIDYLFITPPAMNIAQQDIQVDYFADSRWRTLSDHAALRARATWRLPAPSPQPAPHAPKNVRLSIHRLEALSKDSCNAAMDFFGTAALQDSDRATASFGIREGNHLDPALTVDQQVEPGVRELYATVTIKDDDDLVCGGSDDLVDVNPLSDQASVRLAIDLAENLVYLSNDRRQRLHRLGSIGQPFVLEGAEGDEVGRMVIELTVTARDEPPGPPPVPINTVRDVHVTVERITMTSRDACEEHELYGSIEFLHGIAGQAQFGQISGSDVLPGWTVEGMAAAGVATADVAIHIREDDDVICGGGDDAVDVNPDPAQTDVVLRVHLAGNTIHLLDTAGNPQDPVGVAGRSMTLEGFDGAETARLTVSVSVGGSTAPLPLPLGRERHLTLTVERLLALQSDACDEMEFYARELRFDRGATASVSYGVTEGDDIAPGWKVDARVEPGIRTVDALVNIDEEDDFFCGGGDDDVDINPLAGDRDVRLRIDLAFNEIRLLDAGGNPLRAPGLPEVIGVVGKSVSLAGTQDAEKAQITFRIDNVLFCERYPTAPSCLVPGLDVSGGALAFDAHTAEIGMVLRIENTHAPNTTAWRVAASDAWVRLSARVGTTPAQLTVSIDRRMLAGGRHTATLSLDIPNVPDTRRDIPISIELPPDQIVADLDTLVLEPSHAMHQTALRLGNANDRYTINWSAQSDVPWLVLSARDGMTPAELTVGVDGTGLPSGTHRGKLIFNWTDPNAVHQGMRADKPLIIPVEIRILASRITANPPSIRLNTYTSEIQEVLTIGNRNTLKPIRWMVTTSDPHVIVSPSSGMTPATVKIRFVGDVSRPAGVYSAPLTITSPDVPGQAITVPLEIQVTHRKLYVPQITVMGTAEGESPEP